MQQKLTLDNFEQLLDPVIVDRGLDYFNEGTVHNLEQSSNGLWKAAVQGTGKYRVSVRTKESEILDWECNCPYNMGTVCKHVVATLYEINGEQRSAKIINLDTGKQKKVKKGKKRKTQKEQISEIFKKADKADLKKFIQNQIDFNTSLRHTFLAYFADLIEDDMLPKYKQMVKNFIKAASDDYGFIDYNSSFDFADNIQTLLDKAEILLGKGNLEESIAICQAVVNGLADAIQSMDDSSGSAGSQIERAFEALHDAFSVLEAPMMKDQLFEYCLKEYPKDKYSDFEFDINFVSLMQLLISGMEQEEKFLNLIDNSIELAKNSEYSDWKETTLLQYKIEYLQSQKRDGEVMRIIESNLEYPEIRKILVDKLYKLKEYKKAKKLINEGINLAIKEDHQGTVHQWKDYLLLIAVKEKDIESIRTLNREMFFDSHSGYMEYYYDLKKTYKAAEWEKEVNDLLDIIKHPEEKGSRYDANKMAKIFIAEKYWQRLFKLLELNSRYFHFVLDHSQHLPGEYGKELHPLLLPGLIQLTEPTGRNKYKELARYLKEVMKLPEGKKTVKEILQYVSEKYQNRPAMLEVLRDKFPSMMPEIIKNNPPKNDINTLFSAN